jgi:hypothetical protein
MLGIIGSEAKRPNTKLKAVPRLKGEDNVAWVMRNLGSAGSMTRLIMIGGTRQIAFRLRVAQSHVRHDLTPSSWSDVMLIGKESKNPNLTNVLEISLDPKDGFGFPTSANGVHITKLGRYADQVEFPNVAVLGVPAEPKQLWAALQRFEKQRTVLDSVALMIRWLGYCWGAANSSNPLFEGMGIPSAAMLDVVIGAAGFDLTPGLESRSSCPEAVWQAAKWWHEYYAKQGKPVITGAYCVDHRLMQL